MAGDLRVEDLDVGRSALFLGWAMADAVQRRLRAQGFDGLRFGHGLAIQRLVDDMGPTPSAIAASIGVSLPWVSRSLRELEAGGYLESRPQTGELPERCERPPGTLTNVRRKREGDDQAVKVLDGRNAALALHCAGS